MAPPDKSLRSTTNGSSGAAPPRRKTGLHPQKGLFFYYGFVIITSDITRDSSDEQSFNNATEDVNKQFSSDKVFGSARIKDFLIFTLPAH